MLDVFLTIDTEFWCSSFCPTQEELDRAFDSYIIGVDSDENWGAIYQGEVMQDFGVKATYFLEALCTPQVCKNQTLDLVSRVQKCGHDVEIHVHTEWIPYLSDNSLPSMRGAHLRHFTEDEQSKIIARAIRNLKDVGVENPCAFRAGNFGANWATLRALANNGIRFDTSYNRCYIGSACDMRQDADLLQPEIRDGVYEFPVAFFSDFPGHFRPLHLQACSFSEIKFLLNAYVARGWKSCVLVSHSFETLNSSRTGRDSIVCKRFEKLCRYLSQHRDRFRTMGFSDIERPELYCHERCLNAPRSGIFRTSRRYIEQACRRVLY